MLLRTKDNPSSCWLNSASSRPSCGDWLSNTLAVWFWCFHCSNATVHARPAEATSKHAWWTSRGFTTSNKTRRTTHLNAALQNDYGQQQPAVMMLPPLAASQSHKSLFVMLLLESLNWKNLQNVLLLILYVGGFCDSTVSFNPAVQKERLSWCVLLTCSMEWCISTWHRASDKARVPKSVSPDDSNL